MLPKKKTKNTGSYFLNRPLICTFSVSAVWYKIICLFHYFLATWALSEFLWNANTPLLFIRSVHPSKSITITAFWREPAGWKGEYLFNECWMNVMLIWELFPFSSVINLWIPISSVGLHSDTRAARFKYEECLCIWVSQVVNGVYYLKWERYDHTFETALFCSLELRQFSCYIFIKIVRKHFRRKIMISV